jgi:hypothetical protein
MMDKKKHKAKSNPEERQLKPRKIKAISEVGRLFS